jgi:REP element-mobilizing transposase RayT
MKFDLLRHHRRSIRLKGYDYTRAGAYFVTLVAQGRECLFGEIAADAMALNEYGQIVAETWEWLAAQYPYVELDEWIVMPNHLHGMIVIMDDIEAAQPVGAIRVGAIRESPLPEGKAPAQKRKPLGRLVGAFKTVSAKRINGLRGTPGVPVWQRNYYERIIRNERELDATRRYIIQNPLRWALDRENPMGNEGNQ